MLTPLGVFGWIIAGVLALLLIGALRGGGRRGKGDEAQLAETYGYILAAARYAVRQDEFGVLRGADVLRRVIRSHLGGVLLAGGGLGKQLKKLGEGMGEKDEKKDEKKKKDDHGHGGHGGHGKHEAHPVAAEHSAGATTTVAETVHGHSITLNIGGEKPGHGDGHGHDHDDHGDGEKPPTLEEQLQLARKAVREFEAWWSDKPARMAELRAAHDDLTSPKKPDPALAALFEEKKAH